MLNRARTAALVALGVYAVVAVVYFITLAPSVPFWDAGEFIACSYILGIPHPPGTPLYVLIGRVATLIPWHTVPERINALSAVFSAITAALTYLVGLKLIRLAFGEKRDALQEWTAHIGALTGALLLAFSDTFWENAIEAEHVHPLGMSFAQILLLWLGLRWWEEHERRPTAGPLLLCVYVMWVCVGIHLGAGMMALPLIVLVAIVDRRAAALFAMPFVTMLVVPKGLQVMAGAVILLSTALFLYYTLQGKINRWVMVASAVGAAIGVKAAFYDETFTAHSALVAFASVVIPMTMLARRSREGRILALAFFLMAVGYSTHAYLPIRAAQHPAINEGDPSTWARLNALLERQQYGQMHFFPRRASWGVQLHKEFWRYFRRQWPLFPSGGIDAWGARMAAGGNWLLARVAAIPWAALLPLLLGLAGAVWQARRNRTAFLYVGSFLAISTAGLILFLNFSDHEVRDRDYFFASGYHAYCLWIGLGVAWLIEETRRLSVQRAVPVVVAVALLSQPLWLARTLWFTHDRRGNYVAHDYAYDMLAPLAPNSYVFTNGDNDTFPLWYMQEVEHFRQDVRVVNLSLLNTDWYIQQLRDDPPRVPIHLDDDAIRMLGQGEVPDASGHYILTNEYMVKHIIESSEQGTRNWVKQPYFAVTVPEHMGFQPRFTLEGLVYRVNRDTLQGDLDEKVTRHALYDVFKYRGLFLADGSWDPGVYKDENAATLSRNFAAAHLQLAYYYRRQGKLDRGIAEMERVARMFPDFTDVLIPLGGFYMDHGDTAKALALFEKLTVNAPNNPEAFYSYGLTLAFRGDIEKALKQFDRAIELEPNYSQAFYGAYYCLNQSGQHDRAMGYIQRWVDGHPNDAQARALLESGRSVPRRPSSSQALPRPPQPNLP